MPLFSLWHRYFNTSNIMEQQKEKLKLALIGTAGVPSRYGGFETLVHQMVDHWAEKYNLTVYCSNAVYATKERSDTYKGVRRVFLPFKANGVQSILYDILSIFHALIYADQLLIFGVSGCFILPLIRLISRKKIMVNIDGLEWKRGKWSGFARKFLEISEYFAVKFSHADVTDNAALRLYTSKRYGTTSELIEYGGDHAYAVKVNATNINKLPFGAEPYAFSVCRIEPENNIHLILAAFASLKPRKLVFVGNWDNSEYGRRLREQYGRLPNIELLDPIYDDLELNLLRSNCLVYLHGHSAGGTNPSLVEAMSLGLPILAFDIIYNRETTEKKAFYFSSCEELTQLIQKLKPTDYFSRGAVMRSIANKRYTWKNIFSRYEILIHKLQAGYTKPSAYSQLGNVDLEILNSSQIAPDSRPLIISKSKSKNYA